MSELDDIIHAATEQHAGEVDPPANEADPAPEPSVDPAPEPKGERVRDDTGKFTADEQPTKPKPVADKAAPVQADPKSAPADTALPAMQAPLKWRENEKAVFAKLPAEAQAIIHRREREISMEFERRANETKPLREFEAVIEPHRQRLASLGMNSTQAMEVLLRAHEGLQNDPLRTLLDIAQQRGIHPQQLLQYMQPPPQVDPAVRAMHQQLNATNQQLQQLHQEREHAALAQSQSAIDTFKADKIAHPYFDEVEPVMERLFLAKVVTTLDEAYRMAIASSPDIAHRIQADQRAAQASAARKPGSNVRRAPSSINGAPAPGGTLDRVAGVKTLDDAIMLAREAHAS